MSPETQQQIFQACAAQWGINIIEVEAEYNIKLFSISPKGTNTYWIDSKTRPDFIVVIDE